MRLGRKARQPRTLTSPVGREAFCYAAGSRTVGVAPASGAASGCNRLRPYRRSIVRNASSTKRSSHSKVVSESGTQITPTAVPSTITRLGVALSSAPLRRPRRHRCLVSSTLASGVAIPNTDTASSKGGVPARPLVPQRSTRLIAPMEMSADPIAIQRVIGTLGAGVCTTFAFRCERRK